MKNNAPWESRATDHLRKLPFPVWRHQIVLKSSPGRLGRSLGDRLCTLGGLLERS